MLSGTLSGATFVEVAPWSLSSGTNTDGTYLSTATIPQGQSSGDYYLATNKFSDIYGNKAQLYSNVPPYSTTLRVENTSSPTFTSNAIFTADENQTAIGAVVANDPDGDILTYSITGSEINIDSSTGVISFAAAPDYETKTSYSATVTATDGTTPVDQVITVNVNNLNDNIPQLTWALLLLPMKTKQRLAL